MQKYQKAIEIQMFINILVNFNNEFFLKKLLKLLKKNNI